MPWEGRCYPASRPHGRDRLHRLRSPAKLAAPRAAPGAPWDREIRSTLRGGRSPGGRVGNHGRSRHAESARDRVVPGPSSRHDREQGTSGREVGQRPCPPPPQQHSRSRRASRRREALLRVRRWQSARAFRLRPRGCALVESVVTERLTRCTPSTAFWVTPSWVRSRRVGCDGTPYQGKSPPRIRSLRGGRASFRHRRSNRYRKRPCRSSVRARR